VLIGALAASRRARIYDSVMLKLLGATRGRILLAQALEFSLLAAILAGVAFALGAGAGWYVVVKVLELDWAPDWGVVAATLAFGALVTLSSACWARSRPLQRGLRGRFARFSLSDLPDPEQRSPMTVS
jgi:putative ABC transport system permease protein